MVRESKERLLDQVQSAYLDLWLANSLDGCEGVSLVPKQNTLSQLYETLSKLPELLSKNSGNHSENVLTVLEQEDWSNTRRIEERLEYLLLKIDDGDSTQISKGKIEALRNTANTLVSEIRSKKCFEQAETLLSALDKIALLAGKVAFVEHVNLPPVFSKLVNHMEHGGEPGVMRQVFEEIRNGVFVGL